MVSIIQYGLLALPAFLFAAGVLALDPMLSRRPRLILKPLKRCWFLVLIVAAVYAWGVLQIDQIAACYEGSITLRLNYAEASKGLTPNGTRYNSYDIVSDDVLEIAIKEGRMGDITPRQLRAALSVRPVAEDSASAERYYVATEYTLLYKATQDTQMLVGMDVVQAVASAYAARFCEQYRRKTTAMTPDFDEVAALDYLDRVTMLDQYADGIADYLEMCSHESKTYVSFEGETFASLRSKVKNLAKVELERLKSYILVKGLSGDAEQQISRLNYLNLIQEIKADKNTASYTIRLEAIDMYKRDLATIVLIPTRDETGEFYMSRTKIGVDIFADEAEEYSRNASKAKSVISTNNYAIEQLSNGAATAADYAAADAMVQALCDHLQGYAQKGLAMIEQYDELTTGDQLTLILPDTGRALAKYAILLSGMSIGASLFFAALFQWNRKEQ